MRQEPQFDSKPGGPTPAQRLIAHLRNQGAVVGLDARGAVSVKAPAGVLKPDLVAEVRKRKVAMQTLLQAEEPIRRDMQAQYDSVCGEQTAAYGDVAAWGWTDRALARIDEASAAVAHAIARADVGAFAWAMDTFLLRSTPVVALLARVADDMPGWIACVREWASRGADDGAAQDVVLVVERCSRLGGADLLVRVVGEPREGEIAIEELPALMEATQAGADVPSVLAGVWTMRKSLGPGVRVDGFVGEGKVAGGTR